MSNAPDGQPGADQEVLDGKADFVVSRAVVTAGRGALVCSFDVRPDFYVGRMHRGTAELMQRFLQVLGLPVGTVTSWTVTPMCTPFYAYTTQTAEWRERVAEAWRVSVELSGVTDHDVDLSPGRTWYVRGWDSTLANDTRVPGFWAGEPIDAVVVADCHAAAVTDPHAAAEAVAARFPQGRVRVTEYPCPPFSALSEVRITLPGLRLPDSLDELQHAIEICEELGMTTHESYAASLTSQMRLTALMTGFQPRTPPDQLLASSLSKSANQRHRVDPLT